MSDEPNYVKQAFMEPVNLVFLITALAVTLLTGGVVANVLLLFAAAAELMYLGTMPRSDRYKRVVRSRQSAERNKPPRDADVLRSLSRDAQKRHVRLRHFEEEVRKNYAKLRQASQGLLDAQIAKLDGLLDSHMNLLQRKEQYQSFAQSAEETEIVRSITALQAEMPHDPPAVARAKGQRLAILQKRLDKFKRTGENLALIEAQLQTIEDVTKYVYEQSLTMENPAAVAVQLDRLLSEVEETQASVQEIEEVFADPMAAFDALDLEEFDASVAARDPDRLDLGPLDTDAESDETRAARDRGRASA